METEPLLREAIQIGPVAIDDGPLFLQLWHYLPANLKSHIFYVADPDAQAAFAGSDNIDLNFVVAQPWFGFPIRSYGSLVYQGARFRVYHSTTRWAWLPHQLVLDGFHVTVLGTVADRSILEAGL